MEVSEEPVYLSLYSDGLRSARPGFDSRQGQRFFFSQFHSIETNSGIRPASYLMGTGVVLFPGVKRLGREADD
jgi:hypothetical protein